MRLLHKSSVLLDLPDLGFAARDYALMDELIQRPDGIILVTGPTGTGKTTTLYACLNRINHPNLNILTAEDPVEYELGGIHQVHVQPKIGLTFASALRAFLRQDPDVIMVGEIRDNETAEIAIHASLTGHLVLSTHPHQRRRRRHHAPGRDGDRAVPRALDRDRHARAAPRAHALPALQGAVHGRRAYELEQLGLDPERIAPARRSASSRRATSAHGVDYEPVGWREPGPPDVLPRQGLRRAAPTRASPAGAASTSC